MDTDSFIIYIKTEDVYEDIANNVEKRFDTSNYIEDRPLTTGKNKRVIGLMKDELGGKIISKFVALRPKSYSYLMDDGNTDKKAKGLMIKFNDYKNCLMDNKAIFKSQQRFKSETHNLYTDRRSQQNCTKQQ